MGLRSYISNATKSDFWKPKGDKLLWVAIIVLALASLLFVYSATGKLAYRKNEGFTSFYLWKQLCLLLIGYLVIICVQNFSIKRVINWSALLLTGSIILMLVSWALGHQQNGAGRWIYLPGGFSFQPSEIAKLCVILYVAKEISFRQVEGVGYNFLWRRWILPIIAILLIFKDDVSTAIILATTCFIVVCVGGLPWKRIFGFLAVVILLGVLGFATINYIPSSTLEDLSHVSVLHRLPTVQNRIHRFISPIPLSERDKQSVSDDQTVQSEIAIASGRFVGKGPGNSTQCNVMAEPYSDFIFAIIMEESGLIGLGVVIICYILIFISAFRVMFRCSSLFIGLVVWGIVVSLLLQAIVHMAVCVGLLPITGQTLPLLSKGGTSLLVVAFELGIVLSASLEPEREREEAERRRLEEESDDQPWEIDEAEADEVFHAETPKDITDHWRYD